MPDVIDLVVIVHARAASRPSIDECADLGVKNVIIISAGFKEIGAGGRRAGAPDPREGPRRRDPGRRPELPGRHGPLTGLNATFAAGIAEPGNVGFVSQCGALLTAVLDWSMQENVGFSAVVSLGSMLDVGWGDVITYLGNDPAHPEHRHLHGDDRRRARLPLGRPRGRPHQADHRDQARAGRRRPPRPRPPTRARLTGSDEVLAAAFRRVGVLRVDEIADLFYVAEVLAKQPRPKGKRLTIVTNAGGPASSRPTP